MPVSYFFPVAGLISSRLFYVVCLCDLLLSEVDSENLRVEIVQDIQGSINKNE